MAIRRLFWDAGSDRDIHLLRGQTSRALISTGLHVVDENGDKPGADNYLLLTPGDRIVFTPRFKRTNAPPADYENNELGFRVDQRTGAVTALAQHTRIKHNFIIEIQGHNQDGSTSTTETIRVHVHDSVSDLWLTPERLTVRPTGLPRPEGTTSRFSLRVQFDTGVVGDLTDHHGVTWTSEGPGGTDNFFADGKLRIAAVDTPGSEIPIRATLPASLSGRRTDPATLRIGHPWTDEPDPPEAETVVGGAGPGVAPDRVPNVLVLGDGFLDDDSDAFDGIVDRIVHHLRTNRLMRPYDLLSSSMNFWKVFLPSDVRGISFRCEVYTLLDGSQTWAVVLPPVEAPPDSGNWGLEHLLYAAGLPVPFDATRPNDLIKADWDAVLDTSAWPSNVVSLIDNWKKLANRGFLEQLDGFPGMSFGGPPAASTADYTLLNLFEDRGGTTALRSFYRSLKAENGITTEAGKPVGDLWATIDFSLYDFDNTDLVLLISSLDAGRAVNGTGYIAMSRGEKRNRFPVEPLGGGRIGWTLDLQDSPSALAAEQGRTAAHELGHSFGLGDEYVARENKGNNFPNAEASLEPYANLQTEADIRAGAGILIAGEIKWNWHRIRKAAVIDGDITVENGGFRVPVVAGQATRFEVGDEVLLRVRTRGHPLQKRQTTLSDGKLLKVVEALTDSSVVVEPIASLPFDALKTEILGDYKKGSILFAPTPAPASIRSAVIPFARMIASNIQGSIEGNDRPLTAKPCVFDDSDAQKPNLAGVNLPGVLCFKHKPRIIGLYSGGDEWPCGIFHPAGQCMMRNSDDGDAEFCAVCRYILVDFINPFRHFEIDRDYAEIYPQE